MWIEGQNTPATDDTGTGTPADAASTDSTTATEPGEGKGQGNADNGGKPKDDAADPDAKADDADADGEGNDDTDDEPQGAPEQYEDFTLPEGFALDGDRLAMAHEFAKANNWTQEQAQEGVNTYLKFRAAELEHERGAWGAQSEEEFGKDFKAIAGGAKAALVDVEKLRPGITDRLDATNLGNHPDILWLFNRLGKLASATPMHGLDNETGSGGGDPKETKDVLYPGMKK